MGQKTGSRREKLSCIIINPYKMDSSRQNTVEKTGYLRSPSDKDPKI